MSEVAGWERKVKSHVTFQIQTLTDLVLGYSLWLLSIPGKTISLLFVFSVLKTWIHILFAWDIQVIHSCVHRQLHPQVGGPKIWLDRNVCCITFVVRVLPTVASSQGNCLSLSFFWLFLEVTLDLGKSRILWVAQYCQNICFLSWLKVEKIFEKLFFKETLWLEVGQTGS